MKPSCPILKDVETLPLAALANATPVEERGFFRSFILFIGPESDHWLPLSLTNSLTHCGLVDLIDVTLTCVGANSKLVDVVSVADVDAEERVHDSLVQLWKLKFWSYS